MTETNNNFDTHKHVKELLSVGFHEVQAEAIMKPFVNYKGNDSSQALTVKDITKIEDKLDNINIHETLIQSKIDLAIEKFNTKLDIMIENFHTQLNLSIKGLDGKMDRAEEKVNAIVFRVKLNIFKWFMPFFVIIISLCVGILIKIV